MNRKFPGLKNVLPKDETLMYQQLRYGNNLMTSHCFTVYRKTQSDLEYLEDRRIMRGHAADMLDWGMLYAASQNVPEPLWMKSLDSKFT
jgi:hypothetical protein